MRQGLHILGIRHHGPGSTRSMLQALEEIEPQCVLVEGPPDADELIPHMIHPELTPPVAILVYAVNEPRDASYYPMADFSPEWQACRWAIRRSAAVKFMDLPRSLRPPESKADVSPSSHGDPFAQLARAAGFEDGERWWEHVMEHRSVSGIETFESIEAAITVLRESDPQPRDSDEPYREAWMRKTIREAKREGYASLAIICGAWHAPALRIEKFPAKADDALLKGLTKVKTAATWVPWTHQRLTFASGYGAGVASPGWYEHLWQTRKLRLETWMTRQASLLRSRDIDCSSASVIEGVQLAEALAALRDRPLADLADIADATRAVFCFDSDAPLKLIQQELLVGSKIGHVPDDVPMVPLQQDLTRTQKRLRLKCEANQKTLDLDLRNDNDRLRSQLLHRLRLLGIPWGETIDGGGGKGTFHELWMLSWEPGFAITLVEAGALGNTVQDASATKLAQLASTSNDLAMLSALLHDAMLADLESAVADLVRRINDTAAVATDVQLLMRTLPGLARVLRYGNVRDTDQSLVRRIIHGLLPRIFIGLPTATASLSDDAAVSMESLIRQTDDSIVLIDQSIQKNVFLADWRQTLAKVSGQESGHGLVRGRATRLLFDAGHMTPDHVATTLSQALSRGAEPATGARWIEGFLSGSSLLLIHDATLMQVLDAWLSAISGESFEQVIPLLRRTFSTFPGPERRQLASVVRAMNHGDSPVVTIEAPIDMERASRVLPLLIQILS